MVGYFFYANLFYVLYFLGNTLLKQQVKRPKSTDIGSGLNKELGHLKVLVTQCEFK